MNEKNMGDRLKSRLAYIDNIKGFGMLLVVFGHVLYRYSTLAEYESNLFMSFVVLFYMKMFFFFSGYVYTFKDQSVKMFVWHSFKSLVYPCLIIWGGNIIALLGIKWLSGQSLELNIPREEYVNFYWFCKCLFVSRVVLYLSLKPFKLSKHYVMISFMLNIALLFLLYVLPSGYEIPWGFKSIHIFYVLGYVFKEKNIFEKVNSGVAIPLSFFMVIVLSTIKYSIGGSSAEWLKISSVLIAYPVIFMIYYIFKIIANHSIWLLTSCGTNSLLLYIIHICLLSISSSVIDLIFSIEHVNRVLWICGFFPTLLMISLYVSKYIKYNKVLSKFILLK